ncbi:MAG: PilZ domain-containing protein [Desulfobacterales bacterium]|nr:PilZ domain-containing protein [Desulfobacterales bacterium]
MAHASQRNATRSQAWPDTKAYIKFTLPNGNNTQKSFKLSGSVTDIGSCGMFLQTVNFIPVSTNLDITICFDSDANPPNLKIDAQGQVVRSCEEGVGIRFISINLERFRKCVIEKINQAN